MRQRTVGRPAPEHTGKRLAQHQLRRSALVRTTRRQQGRRIVNQIIWLVGAVVIVMFVVGYFGMS